MNYSLGQRITNRDEDFIVTDLQEDKGAYIIHVDGVSELVKGQSFVFDTKIDRDIKVLQPEKTQLIPDVDYGYRKTKLFVENQIRKSPIYKDQITIAHKAAFNLATYQLEPTLKAFQLPRPRMLMADAVGLGKTIEVGIFLSEMIKRGKGKRIMVLALKSILAQFQQEIWNRFSIPLVRLDSEGISKIKSELPVNKNPFEYYDKTIVSIDTLKNNAKFQHYIEKTHWDIIVIDECHTVANEDSQRGSLAQLLSTKCESLIMTSATPHNGKKENFANLINMIEPLAIKDESNYTKEEILPYYVRRFKNDIQEETVRSNFQERKVISLHAELNQAENEFLELQQNLKFSALSSMESDSGNKTTKKRKLRQDLLFSINIFKAYMSSPEAALKTIENRIRKIEEKKEAGEKGQRELDNLLELKEKLHFIIDHNKDSKYKAFRNELIRLKWNGRKSDFRIVVFAERIETLLTLKQRLIKDFKLKEEAISEFHGGQTDIEQQNIIEDFGKEDSNCRVLLTSDAGSQGVNLHYYCNHMFNYDIPWSLITLDQRNGRIDRYGQTKTPYIHYLIAKSDLKGLKDDLHIVNKLVEKEEEVHKSLGDAASVFKLYDPYSEEKQVIKGIIKSAETGFDSDFLFGGIAEEDDTTPPMHFENPIHHSISLFENDKAYYDALITQLKTDGYIKKDDAVMEGDLLEVKRNPEWDRILYDIPPETKPKRMGDAFQLSLNKDDVQKSINAARKKKGEWAQFQMLYELHPIIRFYMTQLEASVDKDVALVSKLSRLPKESVYFLIQGQVSNNLGQALLSEFFVVPMHWNGGLKERPVPFEDFLEEYELNQQLYTEEITEDHIEHIQKMLPLTIEFARTLHMNQLQNGIQMKMEKDLAVYNEQMKNWKINRQSQLELDFEEKPQYGFAKRRKQDREHYIETILSKSSQYFKDLTSLNGDPYLKVLAVFYND